MPIQILSPQVASQIAAGEVVERPASVVKELIENSIDAGASQIIIRTEGGGRELIEVSDDGEGIPSSDISLAVERYATSKLISIADLYSIRSLGFRGEALASIGSVARLEISSRCKDEAVGSMMVVEGGEAASVKPVGTSRGTRIQVRDLFYNVPARYKFLKTDQTENRKITELVSRYALAYPDKIFEYIQNGKQKIHTTGQGDLRETVSSIYGFEIARQMIEVGTQEHSPFQVSGVISPPGLSRSNRRELTFFVNGRWIQDAGLSSAVIQAYHGLLMVGRYPLVILNVRVPPQEVDVNVHPTKAEVRFEDQRMIFSVLQRIVRASLIGQAPSPSYAFPSSGHVFQTEQTGPQDWVSARFAPSSSSQQQGSEAHQPHFPGSDDMPLLRSLGQFGSTYLVAEGPDGLYLIDQHAAHERVLFEAMMKAVRRNEIESQSLLTAETMELTSAQTDLLKERLQSINQLGFQIEEFGEFTFRITSVPVLLSHVDPLHAVHALVDDFDGNEEPLRDEVEALVAARVCKRGAVKAGQVLSLQEQENLLRDLERCDNPRTCPHGRPTMIHLSVKALERQFGRLG